MAMSDLERHDSGQTQQDMYDALMAARSENTVLRSALEQVRFGLTNEHNKVWPTVKAWTKKERDEVMLGIVRNALGQ